MLRVTVRPVAAYAVAAVTAAVCAACGVTPSTGTAEPGVVTVAATINAWGSILAQLGGVHVRSTSIVTNPDTDPHDYEPTPADGRTIARSRLFVENGIGYDAWAARALAADPDPRRVVVNVGHVVGVRTGGNPHRWYSATDVEKVADAITAGLKVVDPADAAYFDAQRAAFETQGLARYHRLVDAIRTRYAGTAIGASESVVAPLADALGLDLVTPPGFLRAVSEGIDPSVADKTAVDAQIARRRIEVFVVNRQNSTPDVSALVHAARARGIPVVAVTETLSPAGTSYQDWQSAQLQALADALHEATGR